MSLDLIDIRLAALQQARAMLSDRPYERDLAATLRLAAKIEDALWFRGFKGCGDDLSGLFDEVDNVGPVVSGGAAGREGPSVGSADCKGDLPDESLAGEAFVHNSSPVAGVDTATVGQGGEAVTASPPGRPAEAKADTDAVPDSVALALGRAEIARRRADGFELTWTEGGTQIGFAWMFRVVPASAETGIRVGGCGGGGPGAVTAQFPRRVGEK